MNRPRALHSETNADICREYKFGMATLRRLIKVGLPCQGKGRARRFCFGEVEAWRRIYFADLQVKTRRVNQSLAAGLRLFEDSEKQAA